MPPFKLFHPSDFFSFTKSVIFVLDFFASSFLLDFVLPMTFGIVLYTQSHFNGLVLTQFVYEVCHVFHFQTNETNVVIVAGGPYLLF